MGGPSPSPLQSHTIHTGPERKPWMCFRPFSDPFQAPNLNWGLSSTLLWPHGIPGTCPIPIPGPQLLDGCLWSFWALWVTGKAQLQSSAVADHPHRALGIVLDMFQTVPGFFQAPERNWGHFPRFTMPEDSPKMYPR